MHILEEFWYENINPAERPFQKQRGFDKVFRMLAKNEEKPLETLNEQEKEFISANTPVSKIDFKRQLQRSRQGLKTNYVG